MNNEEMKKELDFISKSLYELKVLSENTDVGRFADMLEKRFDHAKDEVIISLEIYENSQKRRLRLVK